MSISYEPVKGVDLSPEERKRVVICPLCGFKCKNRLEAYSPVGGGQNFINYDKDGKCIELCVYCAKIIALTYVARSEVNI